MNKKLYRSSTDSKISGVCGGFAEYTGIDSTIISILWVLLSFTSFGIILYIACVFIIPMDDGIIDADFSEKEE